MPSILKDGKIISNEEASSMMAFFEGSPGSFDVEKSVLDDFWGKVQAMKEHMPEPSGHDMGLRFYMGKSDEGKYGVVAVPMYGPKPVDGSRDRSSEKEASFFTDSSVSFFALACSSLSDPFLSSSVQESKAIIKNTDGSGKKLVYFSEKNFAAFFNGLSAVSFSFMRLNFARTEENGDLTLVISFFDDNDQMIESTGVFNGEELTGFRFDNGQSSPPPSNISDSSF